MGTISPNVIVMTTDNDRPQDVGRDRTPKRRRGIAESDPLLARYQTVLRAELVRLLDDLEATTSALDGGTILRYEKMRDREERVELAAKIARELGTAIDADTRPGPSTEGRRAPRPRRVAYT